ncbi:hypothetical protein [Armatimonas sp.]|uniref:hypothetical protein n=1 Tax=Armatimonas sp. TaxID=1872638 RepID=UPI00286A5140|nr:hypothetical protein [Armatimonas sp.]
MKKLLCFLLALLGGVGCRSREEPHTPLLLPAPDAQGVYSFTAHDLFDLYEKDGKQADRQLRGKQVLVTGYVVREHTSVEIDKERAKKGEITNPDLFLYVPHESNGFYIPVGGVICNFPNSARDRLRTLLKKLKPRDPVTVRGTVDGKMGSVFLKDCTLEKAP